LPRTDLLNPNVKNLFADELNEVGIAGGQFDDLLMAFSEKTETLPGPRIA
jgi:hypothetical protein